MVLDLSKQKRKQLYQVYLTLRGKYVGPKIKALFEEHKKTEGKAKTTWLAFQTEKAQEMLAEEPAKLQEIVRRCRDGEFGTCFPELPEVIDDDFELKDEDLDQVTNQKKG